MYMMILLFGQSLMVTDVTVIVLREKITPYYNVLHVTVSMETKLCMEKLTCDCMIHHGSRLVCKVSDLYYLRFLRYRVVN